MQTLHPITATTLSRYVRLECCERFMWLRLNRDEENRLKQSLAVEDQVLTPLLIEAGDSFEKEVVKSLGSQIKDLFSHKAEDTFAEIQVLKPGQSCLLTQALLKGKLGGWFCEGRSDVIQVSRRNGSEATTFDLLVADIKSSRHDRVEYRLQVAFYLRLLEAMLREAGLQVGEQVGTILKKQSNGSLPALNDPANFFDLEPYKLILSDLLEGEQGELGRINELSFKDVPYALGYKCDGCIYNGLCMADSNIRQDVTLVPFIQPAITQALRTAGVHSLRDLAMLKVMPSEPPYNIAFEVAPDQQAKIDHINRTPSLGVQLDRLVQRASARLSGFDKAVRYYPWLLDASFSTLPDNEVNPDLVKIFLDAQHDYLQDRLYLIAALVQGPKGSIPIVQFASAPPDDESEGQLLKALLQEIVIAIQSVAADSLNPPLHLYVYDSYEQKVWLEALGRHSAVLTAVPALFALLSSSPALEQPMLGVLAREVRERRNLPITCQTIYNVASYFGFKWQEETHNFQKLFYQRVFDNSYRREDGVWVQRFSRFDSHIPLEYAYGTWKCLPGKGWNAYRNCQREDIIHFEKHRLQALAHIEAKLGGKNKHLVKEPLALTGLMTAETEIG